MILQSHKPPSVDSSWIPGEQWSEEEQEGTVSE